MLDKTKNYKIDVSKLNTEERCALQEELFKMGYEWYYGGKKVSELNSDTLFLTPSMNLACGSKKDFNNFDYPILLMQDILPKLMETITLRDLFAGLAMVQLMQVHEPEETVGRAYLYADAMLKERNK